MSNYVTSWGAPTYSTDPKPKHISGFNLTGSLKAKVENTYNEGHSDTCFCAPNLDVHKDWCVYGKPSPHEGTERQHLLAIDEWSLSKIHYDPCIYGGLVIPDRYEIVHSCPVALWKIELAVEGKNIFPCRACCEQAPDELIAVYLLHKGYRCP